MSQEIHYPSNELALEVLKSAVKEGSLADSHKAELAELAKLLDIDVRSKVSKTFEADEIPADVMECVNQLNLKTQYDERLNTLKHYGFLDESGETKEGDVKKPTFEEAVVTFKPEELEIAGNFHKPVLLIVPETSFVAKVRALDADRPEIQENYTYVNSIYANSDSDSDSDHITGWRVVIVDGEQKIKAYDGDELNLNLGKRIKCRKNSRKDGEKGMDRHMYALLMMESIKNGDPVDRELYTLLDDDSALTDDGVPSAFFIPDCEVYFRWFNHEDVDAKARFRSSVGGDVMLS